MRLSRDKMNKLAHTITDALAEMQELEFVEDRNTIRMETRKILEELFNQESRIDAAARRSRARSAPSWKARKSGTSSTASTTTKKLRSWEFSFFFPVSALEKNDPERSEGPL